MITISDLNLDSAKQYLDELEADKRYLVGLVNQAWTFVDQLENASLYLKQTTVESDKLCYQTRLVSIALYNHIETIRKDIEAVKVHIKDLENETSNG